MVVGAGGGIGAALGGGGGGDGGSSSSSGSTNLSFRLGQSESIFNSTTSTSDRSNDGAYLMTDFLTGDGSTFSITVNDLSPFFHKHLRSLTIHCHLR